MCASRFMFLSKFALRTVNSLFENEDERPYFLSMHVIHILRMKIHARNGGKKAIECQPNVIVDRIGIARIHKRLKQVDAYFIR